MKKQPILVALTILLLGLHSSYASEKKPPLPNYSGESQSSPITKEILDNGLRILIKEDHYHPLVTVLATVDSGLSSEGEYGGTGISHFIEHMLFKETSKRKPGQIEKEVKSYGGVINGSTGFDSANYHITVPKEYAVEAIKLMEDMIFHPIFDEEELKKEKDVILKEIRLNQDDPERRIMKELWQASYLQHPYKMPIIGYEDLFKGLRKDDLVKYYSWRYAPNNIVLTVVGDIDRDKILSEIKRTFEGYKRKSASSIAVPLEPQQNILRETKSFAQINLGYLAMAYHTVPLSSNELYALDVLGIILGDWDGSRLNKRLVKDAKLLYTVSSFNYTPKYPGLFIIYGVGDYKNMEEAKREILDQVKKISTDGIKTGELDAAKNIVISSYINSLETTDGIAGAISDGEFFAGDPAFFEKYVENVKRVDAETVQDVARKYLREDNLTIAYLCPGGDVRKGGVRDVTPLESPPSRRVLLPNGIRLILREDNRIPKVSLVCAFLGGVRVETETDNGISNLTGAMLLKGTKNRKEEEVASFMESRGGRISHFSGRNSFGVSLNFLSEDAAEALDMLEDVIKNPTFSEEELEKEKEKICAAIKAEDDDIYSVGFRKLCKMLFEGHPYGLRILGEIVSLKKITRKDIEYFYQNFCAPDNMVISVVGDFESEKMRHEIERRFLDMKTAPPDIKVAQVLALAGVKEVNHEMAREQSLVLIGFRGASLNSEDRLYLEILSSVLSGMDGKFYQSLRNELGLSYALGIFSTPGIDTGFFVSYAATDKKYLKNAKDILLKELKNVRDGAVREEELELAKRALIGRYKMALQTQGGLAYRMALDELYGLGYDDYLNYPKIIGAVSLREIREAAQKYIDLKNLVTVTIYGEPR